MLSPLSQTSQGTRLAESCRWSVGLMEWVLHSLPQSLPDGRPFWQAQAQGTQCGKGVPGDRISPVADIPTGELGAGKT